MQKLLFCTCHHEFFLSTCGWFLLKCSYSTWLLFKLSFSTTLILLNNELLDMSLHPVPRDFRQCPCILAGRGCCDSVSVTMKGEGLGGEGEGLGGRLEALVLAAAVRVRGAELPGSCRCSEPTSDWNFTAKMSDDEPEQTIAEDLVVTKYKMSGDIANRK